MIKFTVRLTESENDQLEKLINDLYNDQKIKISKNKMIKKLIKEKQNGNKK